MASPNKSLHSRGEVWPVRTLCLWRDSNMDPGRIPRGFHWAADGAGIARLLAMKASCRRRMFWKHSAILDTPAVAVGRQQSGLGMQFDSRSRLRATLTCGPQEMSPHSRHACWFSVTSASEITGPSQMAIWNLIWQRRHGCGDMRTRAFRRWRNAFSNPI
jgi:hypothetical protein